MAKGKKPALKAGTVMLPAMHREAAIVADSVNEKDRTFDIVWSAGAEVQRMDWFTGQRYVEVLDVSEKSMRLDRFQGGRAPVLDSHQRWSLENVLGTVVRGSCKVKDGQATAKVRMSTREDVAGLVSDIRDGIICNVSPGYITHAYREEVRDGVTYRIATDWEPIEVSFVPVGADPDAGTMRALAEAGAEGSADVRTFPCVVSAAPPAPKDGADLEAARARMRMRSYGLSGR